MRMSMWLLTKTSSTTPGSGLFVIWPFSFSHVAVAEIELLASFSLIAVLSERVKKTAIPSR